MLLVIFFIGLSANEMLHRPTTMRYPNGEYEPLQCHRRMFNKECWCVDKLGNEISGTRMMQPHLPDCIKVIDVDLTPCVQQFLRKRQSMFDVYRPRCTIDGLFIEVQCHGSSCWCVDQDGIERQGSRVYQPEVPYCIMCPTGSYGVACDKPCGKCSDVNQCSHINGSCLTGCSAGYKEYLCKKPCQHGFFGQDCSEKCIDTCAGCNIVDGLCDYGCIPGWKGDLCNKVHSCPKGSYGIECNETCGYCRDANNCFLTNGKCLTGCVAGYKGNLCKTRCERGFYGNDCTEICGNCRDIDQCFHTNGTCLTGCTDGYLGNLCKTPCPQGFYGKECSGICKETCLECIHVNGLCASGCLPGWIGNFCDTECHKGYYGNACKETCGNCREEKQCDHTNGTCLTGCVSGYMGNLCQTRCQAGFFGQDCSEKCIDTCNGCNDVNGLCDYGCKPGWIGYFCNKECDKGAYGIECNGTCGHCRDIKQCSNVNGSCLTGCDVGYKGDLCKSREYTNAKVHAN